MAWFRVDDGFAQHPKVLGIPRKDRAAAVGLWLLAGVWVAANLTDGRVPAYLPAELGCPDRLAGLLVDAGLWQVDEGRGWCFHGWEDYQPTRVEVLTERERKAAAGRAGGLASGRTRRSRSEAGASDPGSRSEAGASPVVEPPSRPVPSRPSTSVVLSGHQSDAREPTDDDLISWTPAAGPRRPPAGLDLPAERIRFLEHNAGRWAQVRDPERAWLGWLAKAVDRQAVADRPTPVPGRPECPVHPGQPTGSEQCPRCAAEAAPPPDLRALRDQHQPTDREAS